MVEDIQFDQENGAAITVAASGVRLHLNDKVIRGTADPATSLAQGIVCHADRDVVICAGRITGFWTGVDCGTVASAHVRSVDLSGNSYIGIKVAGDDCRIVGNFVDGIAGYAAKSYAVAVSVVSGTRTLIENNLFRNLYRQAGSPVDAPGEGVGIILASAAGPSVVRLNRLENDRVEQRTIGIFAGLGAQHVVSRNSIVNYHLGIAGGGTAESAMTCESNHLWLGAPIGTACGIQIFFGSIHRNLVMGYDRPVCHAGRSTSPPGLERAGQLKDWNWVAQEFTDSA